MMKKLLLTFTYLVFVTALSSRTQTTLDYQSKLENLQNKKNILFCGSYFGYGFHEDGIKSSIKMLKHLND